MRHSKGKVVGYTLVLESDPGSPPLTEGSRVDVYIEEDGWELDEPSTQDLLAATAECDRGEVISSELVFAKLAAMK